ncbi:hypothetical protein MRB53_003491 [Persea americana]|uniref:Uncharacterized protein n=1 Tax=Persea americana TaxID=3435 RepID=A0ACC2MXS7_PERAE|nr:hypothetical protein MRB53_003491 [Persea americana]
MTCTLHPSSQDCVGVCASCLRQRLLFLIEASESGAGVRRRKSDQEPPPIIFPRSVSPYIRRSSAAPHHHHLFYGTPQIGPATFEKKKGKKSRLSLLASLFGASRSGEIEKDDPTISTAPIASSSSSWFGAFRKKKSRLFSLDDEMATKDLETERELEYWCERSPGCRKSVSEKPVPVPVPIRKGSQHGQNVSGLGLCRSPLVRASPKRHESGLWLDLRSGNRQHSAIAVTPCVNRSKKILDFGRYP